MVAAAVPAQAGPWGGSQGPMRLLDAVRDAVIANDVQTLRELKAEFLSTEENVEKCLDGNGNTIVHLALGKDDATLKFVVEEFHGDAHKGNNHGKTPLHEAVKGNYVACCKYLLSLGVDSKANSHTLSTVFHTAASCGSLACMEVLLNELPPKERKAKVNELDKNKDTALHKCCYEGDERVVEWLVLHGADVDCVDIHGTTPLMAAVKMGRLEVSRVLVTKKANVSATDDRDHTPLHFAAMRGDRDLCALLVENGASLTAQDDERNNPLHLLALSRHEGPSWGALVSELVLWGGDAILKQENLAGKQPQDLVPRTLQVLFSREDANSRLAEKKKHQVEAERVAKEKEESWAQQVAAKRAEKFAREAAMREEEERITREQEDRLRAAEDARFRIEEEAEQKRIEEEEARRAKAKAKSGGGKKK